MTILIRGMEMPESCWCCPFFHTSLHHIGDDKLLEKYICLRTGERAEKITNGRMGNCPLIPIPSHGDLIDREELLNNTGGVYTARPGEAQKIQHEINKVLFAIQDAPTVIEEEEEK